MMISTKGRYALRVMIDIAVYSNGNYISLKDISARQEISVKYLEQVISLLNKAGFLHSLRGNNGGYKLAKAPDQYTVGDILRITEGSLAPVSCLEEGADPCDRSDTCATFALWQGLDRVISEYLDSVTLQDLLDQQKSLYANNYSI